MEPFFVACIPSLKQLNSKVTILLRLLVLVFLQILRHAISPLFFALALTILPVPAFSACGGLTYNVVATGAFVDIYGGPNPGMVDNYPSVLALSGGGAIMVNPVANQQIRIIKVNQQGKPLWIYAPMNNPAIDIRQTASVVDTDTGSYYLCGVNAAGGLNKIYLLKLNLQTGELKEGFDRLPIGATDATFKSCFLSSLNGNFYTAGTYTSGTVKSDFGTITKIGLLYTSVTVSGSACPTTSAFNAITETSTQDIIVAGQTGVNLCLASYNPSTYQSVNFAISTISGVLTKINYIGAGKIYGYGQSYLYSFDNTLAITNTVSIDTGAKNAMTSYDSSRYLVVGDSSGNAFAKYYDLIDFSACSMDQIATHATMTYVSVDRYSTLQHYWVAALSTVGINRRMIVKLEEPTSLLSCTGGTVSYFNQNCLAQVTPGDCHPQCSGSCLIAHSSDACTNFNGPITDGRLYFFSARCSISGQDYEASSCLPVLATNCDARCGPECFAPADNNRCTRYCSSRDPYIDTTDLLTLHKCSCNAGTSFDSGLPKRCANSVGCSPLCVGLTCGLGANECFECRGAPNIVSTQGQYFTTCTCADGTSLVSNNCVYTANCGGICNDKCFATGDNNQCAECRTDLNIVSTPNGPDLKICSCAPGTNQLYQQCVFNTGCDEACDTYCGAISDNSKCVNCINVDHMVSTVTGLYKTCTCGDGSTFSVTDLKCIYTTGCHTLCNSKCTQLNSNIHCISCISWPTVQKTALSGGVDKCECASPTNFENDFCVYSSGCSPKCGGKCTTQGDNTACMGCNTADINIVATGGAVIKTCNCASGTTFYNNLCLYSSGCDAKCNGYCANTVDNLQCASCIVVPHMVSTSNTIYYSCDCGDGSTFSTSDNKCVYTTGCHPLCNSKCTQTSSNVDCIDCVSVASIIKTAISGGLDKCECNTGAVYEDNMCIYKSNCDPLCNGKCLKELDRNYCVDCNGGYNIDKTSNGPAFQCSCHTGSTQVGKLCMISSGCDTFCLSSCGIINDPATCDDCASIVNIAKSSNGDYSSCSCGYGTSRVSNQCIYSSSCHPLCKDGCFSIADQNKCVDCINSNGVVSKTPAIGSAYSCTCTGGTSFLNDVCAYTLGCDPLCAIGCTIQSSSISCLDCGAIENIQKVYQGNNLYSCACPTGSNFNNVNKCLYSTGCHPFCNGDCGSQNNPNKCLDCIADPMITKTANGDYYSCLCTGGKINYLNTCVYNSLLCHPLCNGYCGNLNDGTSCIDCASISNIAKQLTGGSGIFYTCSCGSGSILTSDFRCKLQSNCDPRCSDGCYAVSNNHQCSDCAISGNIIKNINNNLAYCDCISETIFVNSACLYQATSCSPLCNNYCYEANNPRKCASCISSYNDKIVYSDQIDPNNLNHYACYQCNLNETAFRGSCYIPQTASSCHGLCGNTSEAACLKSGDPSLCLNKCLNDQERVISTIVSTIASGNTVYNCSCLSGMQYDSSVGRCIYVSYTDCHILCGGKCTEKNNNTKCVGCLDLPYLNKQSTGNKGEYSCSCQDGAPMENQLCVYTSDCHPLCGGKCTSKLDHSKCTSCNQNLTIGSVNTIYISPGIYKCECSSGYAFDGSSCKPILTNCHTLCKTGCTAANDQTKCLDCSSGYGVEKIIPNNSFQSIVYPNSMIECRCNNTTSMIAENSQCVYISDCFPTCSKCYRKNDFYSCITCAKNVSNSSILSTANNTMNCSCPSDYVYFNGSCQPIIHKGCHPFCFNSSCITPGSAAMCVSCNIASIANLKENILPTNAASCQCNTNYTDDNNGTCAPSKKDCAQKLCLKCSASNLAKCYECKAIAGLIMTSENTCKCDRSNGYGEMADFSCYKTGTVVKQGILYGGRITSSTAAAIALANSILPLIAGASMSQIGSVIWISIIVQQEISLYSLISIINLPAVMLDYYAEMGVFSYNFLPDFISIIFPMETEGFSQSDNELKDSSRLHPNIFIYVIELAYLFFVYRILSKSSSRIETKIAPASETESKSDLYIMLYEGIKTEKPQIFLFLFDHLKYTLEIMFLVLFLDSAIFQTVFLVLIGFCSFGYTQVLDPIKDRYHKYFIYIVSIVLTIISNFMFVSALLERIGSSPDTVLITTTASFYIMIILTSFTLLVSLGKSLVQLYDLIKKCRLQRSMVKVSDISSSKDLENSVRENCKIVENCTVDDNNLSKDNIVFDRKE